MESPTITFAGLVLRLFSDSDAESFTSAVLESVEAVGRWMAWCAGDYQRPLGGWIRMLQIEYPLGRFPAQRPASSASG